MKYAATLAAVLMSFAASAADSGAAPRIVSVDGEADVVATPDRATLSMSVDKLDIDLKKAEGEVNRIVRAYLAEAKTLGAKDEQVSTTGASVNPEYQWSDNGRDRRFLGYRVTRQVEVRVDALDKLGDFILRATAVGVNQVNPPTLDASKRKELEREALAKAAQDARDKAKVLAETLGVRLGAAYRIVESNMSSPPPVPMLKAMRAEAADGNAEMGVSLGQIRLHAGVGVEFELLPP